MRAEVAVDVGRLRTAVRLLREATSGLTVDDPGGWRHAGNVAMVTALAMAGESVEARSALAVLDTDRHPGFVFLEPNVVLARAWVAAADGALREAVATAHEAAGLAAAQGQISEVLALHTAVCFGDRTVTDRLDRLAATVDGPRAPAAARHAVGLATDDGDALLAASKELERMGALLLAADAAAQASAAHERHGRRGSARSAATTAQRLAQACEGARTPAMVAMAQPLHLTDREREVVTLAAAGLSNRDIADRLVLSVRTVEGHLYRACAKLGASDRSGLAALLRRA